MLIIWWMNQTKNKKNKKEVHMLVKSNEKIDQKIKNVRQCHLKYIQNTWRCGRDWVIILWVQHKSIGNDQKGKIKQSKN